MCGIAGIANFTDMEADPVILRKMIRTLVHRGPDDEGLECREGVGLAMRRLSIIDLAGGRQPIANEDGSVRVVFNGEIYNFRELRRELLKKGHHFSTRADTEVLVHAYEEYGTDFPARLNGMFAFALHDRKNRKLLLARDHLGVKPLYYHWSERTLLWGSEIKAILAAGVKRKLDRDALGEFLTWEYVPAPRTLFRGIRKLEPGCLLEVDLDCPRHVPRAFWDVPAENADTYSISEDEWLERLADRLRKSVAMQMMSDVPLGAFLSGGVDSSLLVAAMGKARTYSIGFDDSGYNELEWSHAAARHLGVEHITEVMQPSMEAMFYRALPHLDDPIGDFSIFSTLLVCEVARKGVKVCLSGDGGDELFGGYETYLAQDYASKMGRVPRPMVRALHRAMSLMHPTRAKKGLVNKSLRFVEGWEKDPALGHCRWRNFLSDTLRESLFTPETARGLVTPTGTHIERLHAAAQNRDPINRGLYVDVKSYLPDNILLKVDRMSMAVSLEARVPYLDPELVGLAFQMPGRMKLRGGKTKVLLKRHAERHIPRRCVHRPKEGFSIPIKNWLGSSLRPLMEELLDEKRLKSDGFFRPETVSRLKADHLSGRANHSHVLWSLMIFQGWKKTWLEGTVS